MKNVNQLVEDLLKVRFVKSNKDYQGIPITSNNDDLAQKQISGNIDGGGSILDAEAISKFTRLSDNRQERYAEYEELLKDSTIAAALEMYADASTQYNPRTGNIIWVESDDETISQSANRLIDVLGFNEKAWRHIYSLCTYGDLYLRLYKEGDKSDYEDLLNTTQNVIKTKIQDENRQLEEYIEYVDDPATIYDLQLKDKTAAFVRLKTKDTKTASSSYYGANMNVLSANNINLYDRRSFVHISLSESIDRNPELLAITNDETGETTVYKIKTGKSLLADAYEVSQTVKLLEESLLLSRLTKSALVRILQIEVGDMPKAEVKSLLARTKSMIEQKMALNTNNGTVSSYNSPGPMENIIYVPTKNGKGAITPNNLGGDVNIKDIVDLEYFNNKKLAALKMPKQFLNYDSPEGLGNGTSLTRTSSRFAQTIMRVQNAYIQGVTTILNLFFLDKGLDYVNKFTVKMMTPSTINDIERDEQVTTKITQARDLLDLVGEENVTEKGKTEITKWAIANYVNVPEISSLMSKYPNTTNEENNDFDSDNDNFNSFRNNDNDMDMNTDDVLS